jgi:hypothetical protein
VEVNIASSSSDDKAPRRALGGRLQHHPVGLPGLQGHGGVDVVAVAFQAAVRAVHGELQGRRAEDRAMLGERQLVGLAPVVEPRRAVHHEPHLAAHAPQHPDQPVPVAGLLGVIDGHEIEHLADPAGGHEPGDQDGRVGEVQLPDHDIVALGGDPEVPAALAVQQGAEHTRRVEPGTTEPVDGAVGGDQRRGLQITNEPMLGDRRVTIHGRSS